MSVVLMCGETEVIGEKRQLSDFVATKKSLALELRIGSRCHWQEAFALPAEPAGVVKSYDPYHAHWWNDRRSEYYYSR